MPALTKRAVAQQAQPGSGPFVTAAEVLWRAGLWPIPLMGEGDGKPPRVRGFTQWRFRPGLSVLDKWGARWPSANVGILTGRNVVVVDIDDAALTDEMVERFGQTPLQVETPSGGRHLYYRSGGEHSTTLRPGLATDVKGLGGYVAAPPSMRPSGTFAGREYSIICGSWADLTRLPPLRPGSLSVSNTNDAAATPTRLRAIHSGRRNNTLFRMMLPHALACDTLEDLLDVGRTINSDCDPPLPDTEVVKTAVSVWKYEITDRNWSGRMGRIGVSGEELAVLATHPRGSDMVLLLLVLRRANWDREVFAVAPKAMAAAKVIPSWRQSPDRYRLALAGLVATGRLRLERRGGSKRGDATLYSFSPIRGRGGRGV